MALTNKQIIDAITSVSNGSVTVDEAAIEFITGENQGFQNILDTEAKDKEAEKKRAKEEAKRKAAEAEEKALRDSLGPDQFLFTDVTGGVLPKSKINHVMFRYPKDTWDEEHRCNIPEIDESYVWNPEVLEGLWLAYIMDEKVLTVGPPGSGKTTAGQQLSAWLRQPYARFNGKDGIEPASFLGYPWASKEGMVWKDGLLAQAVANGYYTAIDEVFKLPPGIQMALQSLYEKGGFLMLDEKPGTIEDKHVYPRKEFRLMGADNSKGTGDDLDKYGAGQMQDVSSLDRFTITVPVDYLQPKEEIKMLLKKFPSVGNETIKRVVAMANLIREGFLNQGTLSLTISPRGLTVVCSLLEKGLSLSKSLELAYINKLSDDTEIEVAREFITSAI